MHLLIFINNCYNNKKGCDTINLFDDELVCIEWFKDFSYGMQFHNSSTRKIVSTILNDNKWKLWTASNGKDDPPPDFYCEKYKLMMEVMRVDDHTFKKNGHYRNPTNEAESKIYNELKSNGIVNGVNGNLVVVSAKSGLPTEQDHNYKWYLSNFERVIEKHNQKINSYKQNHPGYKCIFFIVDESSAYLVARSKNEIPKEIIPGAPFYGKLHHHFFDDNFISCLSKTKADFIIWFSPYKHYNFASPIRRQLPKAFAYDVSKLKNFYSMKYDTNLIFQSEA